MWNVAYCKYSYIHFTLLTQIICANFIAHKWEFSSVHPLPLNNLSKGDELNCSVSSWWNKERKWKQGGHQEISMTSYDCDHLLRCWKSSTFSNLTFLYCTISFQKFNEYRKLRKKKHILLDDYEHISILLLINHSCYWLDYWLDHIQCVISLAVWKAHASWWSGVRYTVY